MTIILDIANPPLYSAALGEDYQQCPSTIGPFDSSRACINVDINDDSIPEDSEDFTAVLQPSSDPQISVDPNQDEATVNIIDNDSKAYFSNCTCSVS